MTRRTELPPSEGSALLNVFGSHVSLAELNGDVNSRSQSRAPSRAPTPPVLKSKHNAEFAGITKRDRSRTITSKGGNRVYWQRMSTAGLIARILTLFVSGVLFTVSAAHFVALGRFGQKLATLLPDIYSATVNASGVVAIAIGLLFPYTDWVLTTHNTPLRKLSSNDWLSLIRGTGAVLGLCYATTKIANAWIFWGLSNPILWYIIDSSPTGLILSAFLSSAGAGLTLAAGVKTSSWHDIISISASYFSAAIIWGNLGRHLFAR